jgi:molybdopterin-guanine dinucleotide biosynthesis protein A
MRHAITTVILAGGQGKRIGGAKGLQPLQGRALIEWVLEAVGGQSEEVLLNVNGAPGEYGRFGCRIIADRIAGWAGPLAGLHSALYCARHDRVACVPCDTPFLPRDLLPRLLAAAEADAAEAAVAVADGKRQPVIGLYRKSVLSGLDAYLHSGGRRVADWQNTLHVSEVVFDNGDAFANINSRDDLVQAGGRATPGSTGN